MTAGTITVGKRASWDTDGWTSVPNRIIRDGTMTALEKFAFSWLASHSDKFTFDLDEMANDVQEGRNKVRDAVRGLERRGLLTRHKVTDPRTGRVVGTEYLISHTPVDEADRTYVESTAKPRAMPESMKAASRNRRSEPAPDRAGAGDSGPDSKPDSRRSGPAPDRPGAGRPGAGRPGAGRSSVPYEEEKTTEENKKPPRRPPAEQAAPPHEHEPPEPAAEHDDIPLPPEPLFDPFEDGPDPTADPEIGQAIAAAAMVARRDSRRRRSPAMLDATAASGPAWTLVRRVVEGRTVARDELAKIRARVSALLGEGIAAEHVAAGLEEMLDRGYSSGSLPGFVTSAANRKPRVAPSDARDARMRDRFANLPGGAPGASPGGLDPGGLFGPVLALHAAAAAQHDDDILDAEVVDQ